MKRSLIACLFVFSLCLGRQAVAQKPFDANWVWFDRGNPGVAAPSGKVWFRREVRSDGPSTGEARVLADDRFTLWVNGRLIGKGGRDELSRFNLNGVVGRGSNVIAIEAENVKGEAGLFVDGSVRNQGGRYFPFDSGKDWVATTTKPAGDDWLKPGFDSSAWKPVKVIGPHAESPWSEMELKQTDLDRFHVADGFRIQRIAGPDLVGSVVAITWGNRGRLIASRERGPIQSVIDENRDGVFDTVVVYSDKVKNCQGLCTVFDDLWAVGDGPQGAGVYRLPDRNHDDKADEVVLVHKHVRGMGEHGPHNVIFGPDGSMYHNMGNHAWIEKTPERTSAVRDQYEGDLLQPRFEDARGHAAGIKIPAGTIWRFTPDGERWWCETAGFRNEYDFAFNSNGDMFSFDSDMEWDVGMPWYRPVRVNHCIPGAEFGWRSGSAKWPEYYFDSLPTTVDVGRGSPTGVVFYEHRQFPKKYRGSFLACDWSMGRIIAVHLKPDGATYTGDFENLVTGNPLNVSDIEVDRDGSVVFSNGGRNTEGGIYRVSYTAGDQTPADADNVDQLLTMPQFTSAWARETAGLVKTKVGDAAWTGQLLEEEETRSPEQKIRVLTLMSQFGPRPSIDVLTKYAGDKDASVRAFATWLLGDHPDEDVRTVLLKQLEDENPMVKRRACEAFVRSGLSPDLQAVGKVMNSDDRWLRFAARLAIERVGIDQLIRAKPPEKNARILIEGMLAVYRRGAALLPTELMLLGEVGLLKGDVGELTDQQQLDALRLFELTLIRRGTDETGADQVEEIADLLVEQFPTDDPRRNAEIARILASLDDERATKKVVAALVSPYEAASPEEVERARKQQIHYALCLSFMKNGWDYDRKAQVLNWFDATRAWEGGHSLQPYLANIVGAHLKNWTPKERRFYLGDWKEHPHATALLLRQSKPEDVADFTDAVTNILAETADAAGGGDEIASLAIGALGGSEAPRARKYLRELYDSHADRRDQLARAIAERPQKDDFPYLIRTLQSTEGTTMQLALGALAKVDLTPEKADPFRWVILSGMKLGNKGGAAAVNVLEKWTGEPNKSGKNVQAALGGYKKWYAEKFPNAPVPELPKADVSKTKYTYRQLFDFLEKNPQGRSGDVARGKKLFTTAKCVKCHRFEKEGDIIGPDLTSVRRRFQRKEIIESLIFPSQVISDQYRMVTIVTTQGLQHNGMPIPSNKDDKITLLLPDATKLEIAKDDIDEQLPSKVSVMPEGILKDLSLQDIADLFAFMETSKTNELTPRDPRAAAATGAASESQ